MCVVLNLGYWLGSDNYLSSDQLFQLEDNSSVHLIVLATFQVISHDLHLTQSFAFLSFTHQQHIVMYKVLVLVYYFQYSSSLMLLL